MTVEQIVIAMWTRQLKPEVGFHFAKFTPLQWCLFWCQNMWLLAFSEDLQCHLPTEQQRSLPMVQCIVYCTALLWYHWWHVSVSVDTVIHVMYTYIYGWFSLILIYWSSWPALTNEGLTVRETSSWHLDSSTTPFLLTKIPNCNSWGDKT